MLLERRTVSRKTPGDGRLEITKRAAARVERLGTGLEVALEAERGAAKVGTMSCTCRGADRPHVHYFLESPLLKRLVPNSDVALEVDEAQCLIRVVPAGSEA